MKNLLTTAIGALFFGLFLIIIPVGYAQTPSNTTVDKKLQSRQYLELLNSVFNFVQENYVDEVDPHILYEGAMKGMLDSLKDPYTAYMDLSHMRDLNDTTSGNFGGVGLHISKPAESTQEKPAFVEVASPIEDTPGAKAGIQAGDLIVSIDDVYTPDISMEEVLKILRGKVGTPVDLIIRRGKNIEFPVHLVRALIEIPTVKYGIINNADRTIGYLRIIEFTPQTAQRVQEALDSFSVASYDSLLIDLRNNPGGLITSVVDVADKFIDTGAIVSTKSRLFAENITYTAKEKNTTVPHNIPIVVLINKGSASASEILSGALKDYHLAYLVGETTYGKGSVQRVVNLPGDDGIKFTMARYYTPSDSNIDKTGIPPDLVVEFPVLSEKEEKTYTDLMNTTVIKDYVAKHTSMTKNDIASFAQTLAKTYPLELRLLRRLISMEVNRTKPTELYDLDFDVQLRAALDVFSDKDFQKLVRSTKTIKELQVIAENAKEEEEKVH